MYNYLTDANDLFKDVNITELHRDTSKAQILLKRALATSPGTNLTPQLLPISVKLLASTDLVTKKLASWYVGQHSTANSDTSILAVNTLLTDVKDPNPIVRALAVRTLARIRVPELIEHAVTAVNSGLKDSDAVVRRTSVLSVMQVFYMQPSAVTDSGLVDCLYAMIRDQDPIVVVNCLEVLEQILADEGGVVINRNMTRHLLRHLSSFPEPQCAILLKYLIKCRCRDEQEALDIMNSADTLLDSSNAVIITWALHYFLTVVSDSGLSHLRTDVVMRVEDSLFRLLSSNVREVVFAVLQFIQKELVGEFTAVVLRHCTSLFCQTSDPAYLKVLKIQLLCDIADCSSAQMVSNELFRQTTDKSSKVVEAAVTAVGKLALQFSGERTACARVLLSVFNSRTDEAVRRAVMQVLQRFSLQNLDIASQVVEIVERHLVDSTDIASKCAMLWILDEGSDLTENAPYILEDLLNSEENTSLSDPELLTNLLSVCCRLFLRRPAQYQLILGRMLELGVRSSDVDVRDKAAMYYALLSSDIQLARTVVLSDTTFQ